MVHSRPDTVVSYEVFMRYVLNAPTVWAFITMIQMYGALFLAAGPYALAQDARARHVLYRLFPVGRRGSTSCFISFSSSPAFPRCSTLAPRSPRIAGATRKAGIRRCDPDLLLQDADPGRRFLLILQGFAEPVRCWRAMKTGVGWSASTTCGKPKTPLRNRPDAVTPSFFQECPTTDPQVAILMLCMFIFSAAGLPDCLHASRDGCRVRLLRLLSGGRDRCRPVQQHYLLNQNAYSVMETTRCGGAAVPVHGLVVSVNIAAGCSTALQMAARNLPGSMATAALVTAPCSTASGIVGAVVTLMGLKLAFRRWLPPITTSSLPPAGPAGGTLGILIPPSIS